MKDAKELMTKAKKVAKAAKKEGSHALNEDVERY